MNRRLLALLAGSLLIVASAGAGCGSSDDTTVSLTKAEFIKQGDAICQKRTKTFEGEVGDFFRNANIETRKNPTFSEAEKDEFVNDILVPSFQGEVEDLRALGAPSGDEDQVDAILTAVEDTTKEAEEDPDAFTTGDGFAKANKLAVDYGFKVCGES